MKEEKAIITLHTPCMSDIIEDLKMDTKEQNLTTSEYLQFAKNYVLNYEVSKDQREQISLTTVGQSSNSNWFKHRIGRITGSVAHRVLTRIECTDPTSLINGIMGKCSLDDDKLPSQIKYGRIHEDDAVEHYVLIERLNSPKFSVRKTGPVLLNNCSFLGASPDGITSDDGVVEAKCLWKFHAHEIKCNLTLRTNSPWFTQIQIEVAACLT